jgi:Spy/CpxP family protein refolding chaperone
MTKFLRFTLLGLAVSASSVLWGVQPQQSSDSGDSGNSGQKQSQDDTHQQGRRHGRMRRGAQRNKMATLAQKLNLTDEQKAQFQEIRQQSMRQAKAIRTDGSLNDEQKKQKMLEMRKQQHQQMFSVLTPDQKQQLKQMREEHKKEMQKSEGPGNQSSARKPATDDDDPFGGMTSDDDGGQL